MKNLARILALSLLGGIQAANAGLPLVSFGDVSAADFESATTHIQVPYDLSATMETPPYEWWVENLGLPQSPTYEELRFQQAIRELAESLRALNEQLPERIPATWTEGVVDAENRNLRINQVSAQWSETDPSAAAAWVALVPEPSFYGLLAATVVFTMVVCRRKSASRH